MDAELAEDRRNDDGAGGIACDIQCGAAHIKDSVDTGYKSNTVPLNYTGNTHGGMVEVNGQWYIFYHRQTNRVKCARQGCAEPITILPDGSIPQVEVTSCGLNNGPLPGKGRYEARIACNHGARNEMVKSDFAAKQDKKCLLPYFTQSGEDREENGDQYIANMTDGAWAGFKYFDFDGAEKSISVTMRGSAVGTLKIFTNRALPPVASLLVLQSGEWTTLAAKLDVPAGTAPLFFAYEGAGAMAFRDFTIG